MDDARTDDSGRGPRAFKRASTLRAAATAARMFAVRVPYPLCSYEASVEEWYLPKSLTSRSDGCRVADVTATATIQKPSNINSHNNSQRREIALMGKTAGNPRASLPPTGGIAILIDILAREALKELMTKGSKGCKPRNLR